MRPFIILFLLSILVSAVFAKLRDMSGKSIKVNGIEYILEKRLYVNEKIASKGPVEVYRGCKKWSRAECFAIKLTDADSEKSRQEMAMFRALRGTDRTIQLIDFEVKKLYFRADKLSRKTLFQVLELAKSDFSNIFSIKTPAQRFSAWSQILLALYEMHARRIVHNDLKPDNVAVMRGDELTLKLFDFEASFEIGLFSDHAFLHSAFGVLDYSISPEKRIRNGIGFFEIGPKADVWSLGSILYCLIYNQEPKGVSLHYEEFVATLQNKVEVSPEMRALRDIMLSCWKRDVSSRPSVKEIIIQTGKILEKMNGIHFRAKYELINLARRLRS